MTRARGLAGPTCPHNRTSRTFATGSGGVQALVTVDGLRTDLDPVLHHVRAPDAVTLPHVDFLSPTQRAGRGRT